MTFIITTSLCGSPIDTGWCSHLSQAKEDVDRLQQLTTDRSNLAFGSAIVRALLTIMCCLLILPTAQGIHLIMT